MLMGQSKNKACLLVQQGPPQLGVIGSTWAEQLVGVCQARTDTTEPRVHPLTVVRGAGRVGQPALVVVCAGEQRRRMCVRVIGARRLLDTTRTGFTADVVIVVRKWLSGWRDVVECRFCVAPLVIVVRLISVKH